MQLARTIRLDESDEGVYPRPAEAGEWAVTGTFAFADSEPEGWNAKQQIAFRDGWLGTASFGRATLVEVVTVSADQYEECVRRLAGYLFSDYGAPDMLAAADAARGEVDDMASLCAHPVGTLLAIEREFTEAGIAERTRAIEAAGRPAPAWTTGKDGPNGG